MRCAHLGLREAHRQRQVKLLLDLLDSLPPKAPVIIAGDFNDWRLKADAVLCEHLAFGEHFTPARSFPARLPLLRLDRIYLRNAMPGTAQVLSKYPWSHLSDHALWLRRSNCEPTLGRRQQRAVADQWRAILPRVFEAMAQAREEILLETFIIFDDKVGQQLQQVLIDAAQRGVRVEVAVDGYGTADLPDTFIAAMTDAGVSFHAFDPQPRLVGMRTNLFRRLHRKIVVVDGERAFIGGITTAPTTGDFGAMAKQDYAVEVAGPVVAQVHAASKRLMSPVLQPPSAVRPLTEPAGTCSAVLVERDKVRSTDIEAHYLQAFRSARQRIVVANAYFFRVTG